MKILPARLLLLLGLTLLLGGCTSFDASVAENRSLKDVKRVFVHTNLNDNRALDQKIAAAFKAHGRTAEVGPLTMMPDDTQAVVSYQDHWAWDFGEYLDFLKITVRDVNADQPYADVTYTARVPKGEKTADTVNRLVGALLAK